MATVSLLCALFAVFGLFPAAEAKYYLSDHTVRNS